MNVKLISSVLFVFDIARSRKFYENVMGQQVIMDHGPNVGFAGGFAIWQIVHASQMIFGDANQKKPSEEKNSAELYFETSQLDDMVSKLDEAGTAMIHPVREQPWGQRVTRFYDPDGHILEVGEPMDCVILRFRSQGLTPAEIAQRTSMPLEIVNQVIATEK